MFKKIKKAYLIILTLFKSNLYREKLINAVIKFLTETKYLIDPKLREYHDLSLPEYFFSDVIKIEGLNKNKRSYNLLIPSIDSGSIYGGISTAVQLLLKFSNEDSGIRIVYTDQHSNLERENKYKRSLEDYFSSSFETFPDVEIISGKEKWKNKFSENDIFISTLWITAYTINNTLLKFDFKIKKFIYLIQDYEPCFYPWSDLYALCDNTYRMNFWGIYNTNILADYISKIHNITINEKLILQPLITLEQYSALKEVKNESILPKKIFIYGRPNKERNLYFVLIQALKIWIEKNKITPSDVLIYSIGEQHQNKKLGNGVFLMSKGKLSMKEYRSLLTSGDIGISLMLSPHPSYPPLEMAASGLIVVTNSFANKKLILSGNILNALPTPDSIAEKISEAWVLSDNTTFRFNNSKFSLDSLGRHLDNVYEDILLEIKNSNNL